MGGHVSIDYVKAGPVATFTIRNGKVNPITPDMHRQMYDALADFEADPELRVGILTGAGDRAFSAGDDIKAEEPQAGSPAEGLLRSIPLLGHQRLLPIPGSPPNMLRPPSGCAFRPRCPYVLDACAGDLPELKQAGTAMSACIRTEELSLGVLR